MKRSAIPGPGRPTARTLKGCNSLVFRHSPLGWRPSCPHASHDTWIAPTIPNHIYSAGLPAAASTGADGGTSRYSSARSNSRLTTGPAVYDP